MSHRTQTLPAPAKLLQPVATPLQVLPGFGRTFGLWVARQHSRRALTRLGTQQLLDIGLTAETARAESQKPFWRG